jgi:two-component system, response regulator PdtaR
MDPLRVEMTRDNETGHARAPARDLRAARRILIVEDNYFVAHQCETALRDAGYDVVDVVDTAEQALEVATRRRPELVLMDIYLPGKRDGIDAAIEIFQRVGIRSVFASALADPGLKARAERAQPLAWLVKPFNDRKLVATVEAALREVTALSEAQS